MDEHNNHFGGQNSNEDQGSHQNDGWQQEHQEGENSSGGDFDHSDGDRAHDNQTWNDDNAHDAREENNERADDAQSARNDSDMRADNTQNVMPDKAERHILSIDDAQREFERNGLKVGARKLHGLCKNGVLDAGIDRKDPRKKFYISKESLDKLILQEKEKQRTFPFHGRNEIIRAEHTLDNAHTAHNDNGSRAEYAQSAGARRADGAQDEGEEKESSRESVSPKAELPEGVVAISSEELSTLKAAEKRMIELEEANKWKDRMLARVEEQIQHDREDYDAKLVFFKNQIENLEESREQYVQNLIETTKQVGSLQEQLSLLEAPRQQNQSIQENQTNTQEGGEKHSENQENHQEESHQDPHQENRYEEHQSQEHYDNNQGERHG